MSSIIVLISSHFTTKILQNPENKFHNNKSPQHLRRTFPNVKHKSRDMLEQERRTDISNSVIPNS